MYVFITGPLLFLVSLLGITRAISPVCINVKAGRTWGWGESGLGPGGGGLGGQDEKDWKKNVDTCAAF